MNNNTFRSIVEFFSRNHRETVILGNKAENDDSKKDSFSCKVAVSPHCAGRVVAICFDSTDEESPLFLNRDAILEPDFNKPYHPEGGHRWWPMPEGQRDWSLYFPEGTGEFTIENWKVPPSFDKISFSIEKLNEPKEVLLRAPVRMNNVKGSVFEILVKLYYSIIPCPDSIKSMTNHGVLHAGYRQTIDFINTGIETWDEDHGLIAPWSLNMVKAGESAWIILPVKRGAVEKIIDYRMSGEKSNQPLPRERVKKGLNFVLVKADGKCRGKKGIPPEISTGAIASVDLDKGLIIVMKSFPVENALYVDNTWNPSGRYGGTAFDCYNDSGAIAATGDYSMFELEGISPVRTVKPGGHLEYSMTVDYYKVDLKQAPGILYDIIKDTTGVTLDENVFLL